MNEVKLKPEDRLAHNQTILEKALAGNTGCRWWREFKANGLTDIVHRVANLTDRMELYEASLQGDMNLVYRINMPVPCWPVEGKLVIANSAVFHLHYEELWCEENPPGWAPLGLFQPLDPWHPNMRPSLRGAICLGKLPRSIPPIEIVYLGYYAVCLQDYTLDETDPDGVLNPLACQYFRDHPEYLPLTYAGLLEPWEGVA